MFNNILQNFNIRTCVYWPISLYIYIGPIAKTLQVSLWHAPPGAIRPLAASGKKDNNGMFRSTDEWNMYKQVM